METKNSKRKILIVEDDNDLCEMLAEELKSTGYDVRTTVRTSEALIFLRQQPMDLLITDIHVPGDLEGTELVKIYRKEESELKVLFISDETTINDIKDDFGNGLTRYCAKPFRVDEFLGAVSNILQ